MNEKLLHYIWQYQLYDQSSLYTTDQDDLIIYARGEYNTNQGPDFLNARIKSGNTLWVGNIELHVKSSDWIKHKHSDDVKYQNVILHVVWIHDQEINEDFPTIELQHRVPKLLLKRYESLLQQPKFIPCENMIHSASSMAIEKWIDHMLIERLELKSVFIQSLLKENHYHWDEVAWWLLFKNFGMKVNGEAFLQIAKSIPYIIFLRHRKSLFQLEALLLGQSGLLNSVLNDDYAVRIQKEYLFLKKKYSLIQPKVSLDVLRMRPANFPDIRLAHLAALLNKTHISVSLILQMNTHGDIKNLLECELSSYWHDHYQLDIPGKRKSKKSGVGLLQHTIINTIVPVMYSYGYINKEVSHQKKAIEWLENMKPEKNKISSGFEKLNIALLSAFDTQAMIHLKNEYCNKMRCLECGWGNAILSKTQ
ncbi:MAG: DUF2851 family protein [Ferruginibacter sp.]|nr:DUF2851 family protein [Ferruginibacter sp.]